MDDIQFRLTVNMDPVIEAAAKVAACVQATNAAVEELNAAIRELDVKVEQLMDVREVDWKQNSQNEIVITLGTRVQVDEQRPRHIIPHPAMMVLLAIFPREN